MNVSTRIYLSGFLYTRVRMYKTYMNVCTRIYLSGVLYTHVRVYIHECIHVSIYLGFYTHMYLYTYMCVCTCIYIQWMYIHVSIYLGFNTHMYVFIYFNVHTRIYLSVRLYLPASHVFQEARHVANSVVIMHACVNWKVSALVHSLHKLTT